MIKIIQVLVSYIFAISLSGSLVASEQKSFWGSVKGLFSSSRPSSETDNNQECSICMDVLFADDNQPKVLQFCGHIKHLDCFLRLPNENGRRCPECLQVCTQANSTNFTRCHELIPLLQQRIFQANGNLTRNNAELFARNDQLTKLQSDLKLAEFEVKKFKIIAGLASVSLIAACGLKMICSSKPNASSK